ncbi:unnamed protein product, partial [marine sediment metagenome]
FLEDIMVIRTCLVVKDDLKGNAKTVVFVMPVERIPTELRGDVTVIDFDLPSVSQLTNILEVVGDDNEVKIQAEDKVNVVEAARGLTAEGAENAYCKSLVEKKAFDYNCILDEKAAMLRAGALLEYIKYKVSFEDIFGNENLKQWILRTINSPYAKMIGVYGIPGCAKSEIGKAVANMVKRACLLAHLSRVRGKFQGEAEEKTQLLFNTMDAFGNPVVIFDELDKALAGSEASQVEGGTG